MTHLDDMQLLRAGPLFCVYRAVLDGRPVAVKTLGDSVDQGRSGRFASARTRFNPSEIFTRTELGWGEIDVHLTRDYYEALLRAEQRTVEAAAEPWNHPGARVAWWRSDGSVRFDPDPRGLLCIILPWCEGRALGALPRAEQRRLVPAMLPALWRSLARHAHGDLSPDDLLLDPGGTFFRILDPGVMIEGPEATLPLLHADFSSRVFTTNAHHYGLVAPSYSSGSGPTSSIGLLKYLARSPSQLPTATQAEAYHQPGFPMLADVVALGAIYFEVLAGVPLNAVLGADPPLWCNRSIDLRTYRPPHYDAVVAALEGDAIRRALLGAGASSADARFCERLVLAEMQEGDLIEHAAAHARGHAH